MNSIIGSKQPGLGLLARADGGVAIPSHRHVVVLVVTLSKARKGCRKQKEAWKFSILGERGVGLL